MSDGDRLVAAVVALIGVGFAVAYARHGGIGSDVMRERWPWWRHVEMAVGIFGAVVLAAVGVGFVVTAVA